MKTPLLLLKHAAVFLCSIVLFVTSVQAQDDKKQKGQDIKQLLDSKEYIFKAQQVTPSRGGARQLTSEYDLRLLGDSLVAYLPYFGRAYSAPIDIKESGLQFTSTNFGYELSTRKKGWDVVMRPKDVSSIQQLVLMVSSSGRATLQVTSTNREPISFNGQVLSRY
ncbi:DUF4251 domain-containing protein [Flavisolibacter tropicus]|uniref:DUF4251 domain-containing protein n=1 Tax=Flavisolibacter tropicus TaxID=1492898 RepID=A0A172U044_9BACT|nr:DUF4251 domain-containing protein [Flavisolibacter tropicus]ANE52729.1 hypothetical protein SY85_21880 [Flavisolibacter tropicus]